MSTVNLTYKDCEVLVAAWQSCDVAPKVNYTRLAATMSYKNAATANSVWCALKKELNLDGNGDNSGDCDRTSQEGHTDTSKKGERCTFSSVTSGGLNDIEAEALRAIESESSVGKKRSRPLKTISPANADCEARLTAALLEKPEWNPSSEVHGAIDMAVHSTATPAKKKRERPPKAKAAAGEVLPPPAKKRGRPPKAKKAAKVKDESGATDPYGASEPNDADIAHEMSAPSARREGTDAQQDFGSLYTATAGRATQALATSAPKQETYKQDFANASSAPANTADGSNAKSSQKPRTTAASTPGLYAPTTTSSAPPMPLSRS